MTFVFISNFFNHHQKPLADALYALLGDDYCFIETEPMEAERLNMGWGGIEKPAYVRQSYTDDHTREQCQALVDEADVVMYGSAPYHMLIPRLKADKLTFKYSERIYKQGCPWLKLPHHFWLYSRRYHRYKRLYSLCASAYASADFAKTFTFLNKAYKWGYFTEVKTYPDVDALITAKKPASILWCSRFLALKHPEYAVEVAKRLRADGYAFTLTMIGNGEQEEAVRRMICENDLCDYVHLTGSMTPEQVRQYMEESEIFLFTSDRNEGWGAVLNESMNSACAVVADRAIGSVPFLLRDGENGYSYRDGDVDDLYNKVKQLLDDPAERRRLATNAYRTMVEEWNPGNAAQRLLHLAQTLQSGKQYAFPYPDGVCSKAHHLHNTRKK